jgi:MFS transporter, ACS family, D-galactonate transporter
LAFVQKHQAALTELSAGQKQAPAQWQHWFYVDMAGMVIFIPLIWLTKGRWRPSAARRDAAEHEARVNEELSRLVSQGAVKV